MARCCTVEECRNPVRCKGLCAKHYHQRLMERPNVAPCSIDGCESRVSARGWCALHYGRWRVYGDVYHGRRPPSICTEAGCEEPVNGRGLCSRHYKHWWRRRAKEQESSNAATLARGAAG